MTASAASEGSAVHWLGQFRPERTTLGCEIEAASSDSRAPSISAAAPFRLCSTILMATRAPCQRPAPTTSNVLMFLYTRRQLPSPPVQRPWLMVSQQLFM